MNDKSNNEPQDEGFKQFTYVENGLVRSIATGVYFFRKKVGGKPHRFSLETTNLDDARTKARQRLEVLEKAAARGNTGNGTLTLAGALDLHLEALKARHEVEGKSREGIAAKTLESYETAITKLREIVPAEALKRGLRKIELDEIKSWLRPVLKEYSASYYNACILVLRAAFDIGMKQAACLINPADEIKTETPARKELKLRNREIFQAVLRNIRDGGSPEVGAQKEIVRAIVAGFRNTKGETDFAAAFTANPDWQKKLGLDGKADNRAWRRIYDLAYYIRNKEAAANRRAGESADMVEFLAHTGARIDETRQLTWAGIDTAQGLITFARGTVKGKTRTKVVPIHPAIVPVLVRCKARNNAGNRVFGIANCRKAIQSACDRVSKHLGIEIPRLSHHDFRHFFATMLVESGASLPMVASLLGHSDNGRTAAKVYVHGEAIQAKPTMDKLNLDTAAMIMNPAQKETRAAQLRAELAALEAA